MVTWSTSIPRSASSSSTSRYDRPKRRYQRTVRTMTSGGKRKPAKADRVAGAGRRRRGFIAVVWLLGRATTADATVSLVGRHRRGTETTEVHGAGRLEALTIKHRATT